MVTGNKGLSSNTNSIPSSNTYLTPTQGQMRESANGGGGRGDRKKEVQGMLYLGDNEGDLG